MSVRPGWAVPVRAGVPGLACASDEEILEQRMRVEMAKEAQRAPAKITHTKPDLLARYTDRRHLVQQEAEEQQQREQEMYEARRLAESEAKRAAMERLNARMSGGGDSGPVAVPQVDEAAMARRREQDLLLQRRLQELQELPDISARAAQADEDVSDESDAEDDPNDDPDIGDHASNDGDGPQDVGYLEVNAADYKSKVSTFVNALYHHGDLGRAEAESILFEQIETHRAGANGRFLVRSARGDEQIISLVHDGAPMHHRLLRAPTGCFTVSGQETSQRDLNSLLVLLSQSDIDWWPSPLTDAIEPVQKQARKCVGARSVASSYAGFCWVWLRWFWLELVKVG